MKPDRAIRRFLKDHPDRMIVRRDYILELKTQIAVLEKERADLQLGFDLAKAEAVQRRREMETGAWCHPELVNDLAIYGAHFHDEHNRRIPPSKVVIDFDSGRRAVIRPTEEEEDHVEEDTGEVSDHNEGNPDLRETSPGQCPDPRCDIGHAHSHTLGEDARQYVISRE